MYLSSQAYSALKPLEEKKKRAIPAFPTNETHKSKRMTMEASREPWDLISNTLTGLLFWFRLATTMVCPV